MSDLYTIEEYESHGFKVIIWQDLLSGEIGNPRDWDNLGHMICSHKRYELGDEQIDTSEYNSWEEVEQELLKNDPNIEFWIPLYLYDHSGITMSCGNFRHIDPQGWDSGQVGFIYILKNDAAQFDSVAEMEQALINEVKVYSAWLEGDVVGFSVEDDEGNILDSCGGFIGDYEYCKMEAKDSAKFHRKQAEREKLLKYEFACRDIVTIS